MRKILDLVARKDRGAYLPGAPILEYLESREFKSVTTTTSTTFTDLSSYAYFADAQYGDNGDWSGVPALDAGADNSQEGWADTTWDQNPSDGVDSGWVPVSFSVDNSSGSQSVSWAANGTDTISFSSGSTSTIHQVAIRAGVAGAGLAASWNGVFVDFYHGSTLGEEISVGSLSADTTGQTSSSGEETIAVVTPIGTGYDHIVVGGNIRIQSNAGVYPGSTDVFCEVAVT